MCPRALLLLMATMGLFSACSGSSDNCPGACSDEAASPTMTISTDDGSPSIASAKILSGPCTALLLRSAGEVGMPTTYAAVQVTYGGPRDTSASCQVELTTLFGQIAVIAAQVTSSAYQQTCCPYGTCCPAASTVTQHHRVEFTPGTQTVSFPPPPDGGAPAAATDAAADASDGADSPAQADATDAISSGIDAAGVDSPGLESPALDGATIDSPVFEPAVLDGAMADSPAPLDLASGA